MQGNRVLIGYDRMQPKTGRIATRLLACRNSSYVHNMRVVQMEHLTERS